VPNHTEAASSSVSESPWGGWRSEVPAVRGLLAKVSLALLAVEAVVAVWLRFSSQPLLWLDETLTVNIARLPLSHLQGALKRDGAPPLYYLILHLWMSIFGTSTFALRSLSGIFSIGALVVTYLVARRVWGLEVALIATALLGASSFATYFATEVRMYSLMMLLVALGALFLARLYEEPSLGRAAPLAAAFIALEYTHYWSFYLFIVMGAWVLVSAIISKVDRIRSASRWTVGAFLVAGVALVPWLPTFLYQSKHTGTPWGRPPNFRTAIVAVFHFNANQVAQVPKSNLTQRGIEVLMIILMGLGLFILAKGPLKAKLVIRGLPRARFVAWVTLATVVLGVVASHYSGTAFVPRYASVAYIPLILFLAVGTQGIYLPWLRVLVVALVTVGCLTVGFKEHSTPRTQAAGVVAALSHAPSGSVVIFCPDQLGPSVMRILPSSGLLTYGYPRFDDPHFINWINYDAAIKATSPQKAALRAAALSRGNPIWLVSAIGYQIAGDACQSFKNALAGLPNRTAHKWLVGDNKVFFQSMNVDEYFIPASSPPASSAR